MDEAQLVDEEAVVTPQQLQELVTKQITEKTGSLKKEVVRLRTELSANSQTIGFSRGGVSSTRATNMWQKGRSLACAPSNPV